MTGRRAGGRRLLGAALGTVAALLLALPAGAADERPDSCFACHGRLAGRLGAPAKEHFTSVHREAGIGCVDCHGGNPALPGEEAMAPLWGFRGKPAHRQIPEICARCHSDIARMRQYNLRTDQLAEYRTSVHGRRLVEKGDSRVAVCTSCHGKHDIRRKSDPLSSVYPANVPETCGRCHADAELMRPYRLPTDQLDVFRKGVHGRILAGAVPGKNPALAPSCATCHGIHGATPPGVTEVANVCGHCHTLVADYFRESAHFAAVRETGEPKCVTCHGNHLNRKPTIRIFSGTGPGECGSCHGEGEKALEFAAAARDLLGSLEANLEEIRADLEQAETSGRNIDRLKAAYGDARNKVIEAGPVLHAFSLPRILPLVHEADSRIKEARQEIRKIREEQAQRRSVAIYAVTMLLLIALLLGFELALLSRERSSPSPEAKERDECG